MNAASAPSSTRAPDRAPFILATVLAGLTVALALLLAAQHLENRRLLAQTQASLAAANAARALAEARDLNAAMSASLGRVDDSLKTAQANLAVLTAPAGPSPALTARAEVRPAPPAGLHLPVTAAPRVVLSTNQFGGVTERRIFDALLAANGRVLARDAEFSRVLGRRVFFRAPNAPPLAFDVDQLHPDTLHYLGLDAGTAKAQQADMDRAKQLASERAEKDRQERIEADRARLEARQKALAERAAAQPAGVSAEQLVTLAALRAVESANYRAPAPPPVIVVPPPQPVWNWPVVWFPHTHVQRHSHFQFANPFPSPASSAIPSGSTFRFIQTENYDPFANGRRL